MGTRRRLLAALGALLLAGCGADATVARPADGGVDASGTFDPASGLSLSVVDATYGSIDGAAPAGGSAFLLVRTSLTNVSGAGIASMSPPLFSVELTGGVVYTASVLTLSLVDGCEANVGVAVGGTHECVLAFEVPKSRAPSALLYAPGEGIRVTIAAPPPGPASLACETRTFTNIVGAGPDCLSCRKASCLASLSLLESGSCLTTMPMCTSAPYCDCERAGIDSSCRPTYDEYETCVAAHCATACATGK